MEKLSVNQENEAQIPVVVWCFDANYAPYAAVSTWQARKVTSGPMHLYWIYTDDAEQKAAELAEVLKKSNINVHRFKVDGSMFKDWHTVNHISKATYLRFLIPEIISHPKVIYMDCDAFALKDIRYLFNVDMLEHPIAGVEDPVASRTSRMPRAEGDIYINAGVLVLNLNIIRKQKFIQNIIVAYQNYRELATWSDQCILNKVFENDKLILPRNFNFQIFPQHTKSSRFLEIVGHPSVCIIHFLGSIKPWNFCCNPVARDFYLKMKRESAIEHESNQTNISIQEALVLAKFYDFDCDYKSASIIKEKLIQVFLKQLERNHEN